MDPGTDSEVRGTESAAIPRSAKPNRTRLSVSQRRSRKLTWLTSLTCIFLAQVARASIDLPDCADENSRGGEISPPWHARVIGERLAGESEPRLAASIWDAYPASCRNMASPCVAPSATLRVGDEFTIDRVCEHWAHGSFSNEASRNSAWIEVARLNVENLPQDEKVESGDEARRERRFYQFTMIEGQANAVCGAYLHRLNQTLFIRPPSCGRPESANIPGFELLQRQFVSMAEMNHLGPWVHALIEPDQQVLRYDAERGVVVQPRPSRDKYANSLQLGAWRYQPPIDVDNDGNLDNAIVWNEDERISPACGVATYGREALQVQQSYQYVIVMAKGRDEIDQARTAAIFGNAKAKTYEHAQDPYFKAKDGSFKGFRPFGHSYSLFRYAGETYFDTFLDFKAENELPKGDGAAILGVFVNRKGKTSRICRYRLVE